MQQDLWETHTHRPAAGWERNSEEPKIVPCAYIQAIKPGSKSHPQKGVWLETLCYFHLYVKGLSRHTINFEGQDKRPSLRYIQASGASSMVQDSSSDLVSSAGGSVELDHGIGPSGAAGCPGAREGCCFPARPGDTLQHCLSWAPRHTQSMEAACEPHISQQIALVIWRSISRAPWWGHHLVIMWGHTSGCRRNVRGNHLGSVFLNPRNLKTFVSGGISHSLDTEQLSSEINLLPDGGRRRRSLCHGQGGGSQLICVCPGFPNTCPSQRSSAVRESDDWYDKVKIPLFALFFLHTHFISSFLANCVVKSCYEILFLLSPFDELIAKPTKGSMQDSQVVCVSHCLTPFKNCYITSKSFPFPDEAVSLISKSLI